MICKKEYSYEEKIQVENEGDYAKEVGCRVLFVNYRLAPKHSHPVKFIFQMLPYPFLDARNNSESCKKVYGHADVEFYTFKSDCTNDKSR